MSKSFQVPFNLVEVKPRSIDDEGGKSQKVSFLKYATLSWLDDPRAYSNAQGVGSIVSMHRWQKVIAKFEEAKQGDWITLDDEDYATLKLIVTSPMRFFPTPVTMACLPYSEAVLQAVDKIPVAVMKNGAGSDEPVYEAEVAVPG